MLNEVTVITHNGPYHADDVLAVAFLKYYAVKKIIWVERRQPTPEELDNPLVFVLDIGGIYNPSKKNFDHHNNGETRSTVYQLCKYLFSPELFAKLEKHILIPVSNHDLGITRQGPGSISNIISGFNNLKSFNECVEWCIPMVNMFVKNAIKSIADEKRWPKLTKSNGVAINESEDYIANWHELAYQDNIMFLVCPGRDPGTWQVVSRDTTKFTIPSNAGQHIVFSTGHVIVFDDFAYAVAMADEYSNMYAKTIEHEADE